MMVFSGDCHHCPGKKFVIYLSALTSCLSDIVIYLRKHHHYITVALRSTQARMSMFNGGGQMILQMPPLSSGAANGAKSASVNIHAMPRAGTLKPIQHILLLHHRGL